MKADLGSVFLLADSLKMGVWEIQDQHFCTDRCDKCSIDHLTTEQGLARRESQHLNPIGRHCMPCPRPHPPVRVFSLNLGSKGNIVPVQVTFIKQVHVHIHVQITCSNSQNILLTSINLLLWKNFLKNAWVYHEHNIQGLMPPPNPNPILKIASKH